MSVLCISNWSLNSGKLENPNKVLKRPQKFRKTKVQHQRQAASLLTIFSTPIPSSRTLLQLYLPLIVALEYLDHLRD